MSSSKVAVEALIKPWAFLVNAQSLLQLMDQIGSRARWVGFLSCLNMLQPGF